MCPPSPLLPPSPLSDSGQQLNSPNLGISRSRNLDLLCCVTSDVSGFSSRLYPNTVAHLKRDEEDFDDEDTEAGTLVIKEEGPVETSYESLESSPTTCK